MTILQDQIIDKFLTQTYSYCSQQTKDSIQNYDDMVEKYSMENFIEFSTENLGIVQSLINSEEEFEICSLDFVKMLLKQLHKSQDFEVILYYFIISLLFY